MTATSGASVLEVLARIGQCLRSVRVAYAMIGAWAVAAWGRPRATQDLDLLVLVDEPALVRLVGVLGEAGFRVDEGWGKWNPLLRGQQVRLQYKSVTIDLMRPRDAQDRSAIRRRRRKRLGRRYCWVVSPEDLVLQKLKVGRPHDFEDAIAVLQCCEKRLDRRYLSTWAQRLGVAAELAYVSSHATGR